MRKAERATLIRKKAREMAATGDYGGWLIIEQLLRSREGYPEARSVLDNTYDRREIDEICVHARQRKVGDGPSGMAPG